MHAAYHQHSPWVVFDLVWEPVDGGPSSLRCGFGILRHTITYIHIGVHQDDSCYHCSLSGSLLLASL